MNPVTVVVLSRFPDILQPFADSLRLSDPSVPVILVRDGQLLPLRQIPPGWQLVQGPPQFSMAGNGNLGLRAVPSSHDILYCGDDIRFLQPDTVSRLQQLAYTSPRCGILSPFLWGRTSGALSQVKTGWADIPPIGMWFPCVFLKRALIDQIGYLDERFSGFGSDDLDYCLRAKLAGFTLNATASVAVQHEGGPGNAPTTFSRTVGEGYRDLMAESYRMLCEKYGIDEPTLIRVVQTGDVRPLQQVTR